MHSQKQGQPSNSIIQKEPEAIVRMQTGKAVAKPDTLTVQYIKAKITTYLGNSNEGEI